MITDLFLLCDTKEYSIEKDDDNIDYNYVYIQDNSVTLTNNTNKDIKIVEFADFPYFNYLDDDFVTAFYTTASWYISYMLQRIRYVTFVSERDFDTNFEFIADKNDRMTLCSVMKDKFIQINKNTFIHKAYHPEMKYLCLLNQVIKYGSKHTNDRTGVGTRCLFGKQLKIDLLKNYFPVQDMRKTPMKTIWREVNWYLSGNTDVSTLHKYNIHIWDGNTNREFLDKNGLDFPEYDMGASYGFQFRHAGAEYTNCNDNYTGKGVDQWNNLIEGIVKHPQSRRHIIQLYNVCQLKDMSLPPCLMMYQFFIDTGKHGDITYIDIQGYSRSSDFFLAGFWNLCQLRIILEKVRKEVAERLDRDYRTIIPRQLIWSIGNLHVYEDQIESIFKLEGVYPQKYYTLKEIDPVKGPILEQEYSPQTKITTNMAV